MTKLLGMIMDAKTKLYEQGVTPKNLYLSVRANESLLKELNERDGKKHRLVFEVCELRVMVDPKCPEGGAYVTGDEINFGEKVLGLVE